MAVLPLNIMQSHCLSNEAFDSTLLATSRQEYGRGVPKISNKLIFKQKTFHKQFLKPVTRSPYPHHVPRALTTLDVSVVKPSENVASYRFMTEIGGRLHVLVKRTNNNKHVVHVEVESLQHSEELYMIWGLFRADSKSFMPLDSDDDDDSKDNTIETPFANFFSGKFTADLEFEGNLPPFYVSFLLKSRLGPNSKISTIRSHRKTNFVVPVGFGSGRPYPLGISFSDGGFVNFAFFSRDAESVVLCLYADATSDKPSFEIDLDPYVNRSGDIWHASVDCSLPFVGYGYRCKSRTNDKGDRVLLDPWAKIIQEFGSADLSPRKWVGALSKEPEFDWSDDLRPSLPMEKLIIYKLNVTRFTIDKSSELPRETSGTFSGVSAKSDHFKNLGVNAVLLEPIFPFDEQKGPYCPWHFFSPGNLYGPRGDPENVARSMKEMVKKMHADGIEVLLEVVFPYTGEDGPLKQIDPSSYFDINGGLNCNYPIVRQMILESLRYWAIEFHIDGFCFVNSHSIMRGVRGEFLSRPPLIEDIAFDPILARVKIIADSWDPRDVSAKDNNNKNNIAFPHWKRWAEMNPKFCRDVRNFLKGRGPISNLATRLCGSGDVFSGGRGPPFSFNFITRNAGLTLVDLVSFEFESECSWNCGEEGPTNKTAVLERRLKQTRNYLFILFISLGVPVLNMGDECGQSSGGSLTYGDREPLDWNALRLGFGVQTTQFISFLSSLKLRRSDFFQRRDFLKEDNIEWRGVERSPPDWDDVACKFLAMVLKPDGKLIRSGPSDLFVAFNSGGDSEKVVLPRLAIDETWVRLVDTGLSFPDFFSTEGVLVETGVETYEMKSHSCVLFEARSM